MYIRLYIVYIIIPISEYAHKIFLISIFPDILLQNLKKNIPCCLPQNASPYKYHKNSRNNAINHLSYD